MTSLTLSNNNAKLLVSDTVTAPVKRFGNSAFKGNNKSAAATNAVKIISPSELLGVLKNAKSALHGNSSSASLGLPDAPSLLKPKEAKSSSDDTGLSRSGVLLKLIGQIDNLIADSSVQGMLTKLNTLNLQFAATSENYGQLSKQLEADGTKWASDSDKLKDAQAQASKLDFDANAKHKALNTAESHLKDLKNQAASHTPVPEALKAEIAAASKAVKAARASFSAAHSAYQSYVTTTLNPAVSAEAKSHTTLNTSMTQANTLVNSAPPQQLAGIEAKSKQEKSDCKTLTFLLAVMSELINKSSDDDLKASSKLKQTLAEASAADAQKKAKEYEEQTQKAEEMNKTMGCVGKILGWLIVAVSCVAAVFSGGASLALAAVGLALAVGDEIYQAATGKSFMQEATQPLMDNVIKPLMDKLGDAFAKALEGLGVSKDKAEMIGKIFGAVAAGVILIAGMVVGGKVLSKVFGAVMEKLGGEVAETVTETAAKEVAETAVKQVTENAVKDVTETAAKDVTETEIKEVMEDALEEVVSETVEQTATEAAKDANKTVMQKILDSALGQVMKKVNGGLAKASGMSESRAAQIATRTQMGVAGGELANSTVQVAGSIVVGDKKIEAAKARAQMQNDAALQDILNQIVDAAIASFTHRVSVVNNILTDMTTAANNQMEAGQFITHQMNSIAG